MPGEFDESDFIDTDYQLSRKTAVTAPLPAVTAPAAPDPAQVRPPTREELDARVHETQQRLEDLKRVQEQLELERTALEEARRRRSEYATGREEMIERLTRGIGLLEESEFAARRDAEQMARALADLREHLMKVQNLNDQLWTQDNYAVELTRALTALENARLEWNGCQLKFPILAASRPSASRPESPQPSFPDSLAALGFGPLCRLGLALTWPIALVALVAAALFAIALLRH